MTPTEQKPIKLIEIVLKGLRAIVIAVVTFVVLAGIPLNDHEHSPDSPDKLPHKVNSPCS